MRPIFIPERARARRADWAPGPGVFVPLPVEKIMLVLVYDEMIVNTRRMGKEEQDVPPVARILMWRALIPNSLQRMATSCAANMAAYGEDSSRSALTFIPPVTRVMVSRPDKSAVLQLALCAVQIGVRMGRHTDVDEGIVEGSEDTVKSCCQTLYSCYALVHFPSMPSPISQGRLRVYYSTYRATPKTNSFSIQICC